jgi:DNA replication licensing factor MCM6
MEQQTISIAKAGIQATLHARTSILAAANPIFGRYDKAQSLRKNINISPPIMSRFDLYFIICDEINDNSDLNLSKFIVSMHQHKKQAKIEKPYTMKQVKNYLAIAKRIKPRITREAAEDLRRFYVDLRRNDKQQQNSQYQVTVRQLESMIRLSEALAKMHLDLEIKAEYVREAYRLLSCAIVKL